MVDSTMTGTGGSLVQRMIRAARLENGLYEEVEADRTATSQAATAVGIVAAAGAIGQGLGSLINPQGGSLLGGGGVLVAVVLSLVFALVGWVLWSYVTFFVGTRIFGGSATPGEMLRTIGFAQSPGVLNVLAFVPFIGGIVTFATFIWSIVAGVIAVRQALDFDTGKAIITTVIGAIIVALFFFLLLFLAGLLAASLGLVTPPS